MLRDFPAVDKGKPVGPVTLADGSVLPGRVTGNPRKGGTVWAGIEDAAHVCVGERHVAVGEHEIAALTVRAIATTCA